MGWFGLGGFGFCVVFVLFCVCFLGVGVLELCVLVVLFCVGRCKMDCIIRV